MTIEAEKLIADYIDWLKSETTVAKSGDCVEITTPFFDRNNDSLQIYVEQISDNTLILSDDGYILSSLAFDGFSATGSRKQLLLSIISKYSVYLDGQSLCIRANEHDFPQKKHFLLQAMLSVDDLFIASKKRVSSFFLDDIQEYFKQNEIYCTENVQLTGTSGFIHTYDFILQRSKKRPERLCRALNSPSKTNVQNVLFGWSDTKAMRQDDSRLVVFINDENSIENGVLTSLEKYDAFTVLWSKRSNPTVVDYLLA